MEISLFRPQDGPGVAALFQAVYGPEYPIKVYYRPEELSAAVLQGRIVQVVARAGQGEVVGVESMFHSAPCKEVYEMGAALVLPSYRNQGISKAMNQFLMQEVIPQRRIPMTFGEPVCNHPFQQKAREGQGYVSMALQVDLMPASAYGKENSVAGRVAALMSFKGYQELEHAVHLPARYDRELRAIYQGSGLRRELLPASPAALLQGSTDLEVEIFSFAQVARVAVQEAGAELSERLDVLLAELSNQGVAVVQAWLKLASPLVGAAVEIFRSREFFLGGVLPRWFGQDGLLLQRVAGNPNWDEIQIASQRSQAIADMVRQDWQSLGGAH